MHGLYSKLAKKAMLCLLMLSAFFLGVNPALAEDPVLVVTPIYDNIPNDPMYSYQSRFYFQIGAPTAWNYTVGSRKVVVAVIDTGLDTSHNDIIHNLWTNIHEIPGNKLDDDHNGYVDDINGWNFVEDNADVRTSVFNTEDDKEAVRHGTLVSGVLGAVGNNGEEGTGINWYVSIMTLRAIKSSGMGSTLAVKKAIEYAVLNGADIISMSFMGDISDTELYKSLRKAHEKGVLIVTAGGNYDKEKESGDLDKKPLYPACFDVEDGLNENWILTVGSVDLDNKLSDFSNYGKCIDILAPGEFIYSTERYAPQFGYNDQFGGPWFGTSFATPLVAGSAALLKSIHPEWSPARIISTLINTADSVTANNPGITAPRMNIGSAAAFAFGYPKNGTNGSIFYVKGSSEIWKYNLLENTAERISKFSDANIISLNVYNYLNREQAIMLLRRRQSFVVRLVHGSGEFIKEFQVPNNIFSPSEKFQLRYVEGDWLLTGMSFNGKQTLFKTVNLNTKKLVKKTIPGKIDSWGMLPGGNIVTGSVAKNTLNLEMFGKESKRITILNIGKLHALSTRSPDKVFALVQKGSSLYLVKINLVDDSHEIVSLGVKAGKDIWEIKSLGFGEKTQFIPFARSGGSFAAYDEDLNPTITVNLRAIPAITQ